MAAPPVPAATPPVTAPPWSTASTGSAGSAGVVAAGLAGAPVDGEAPAAGGADPPAEGPAGRVGPVPGEAAISGPDEFFRGGTVVPPPAKKMRPYAPRELPRNGLRPFTNCTCPAPGTSHDADANRHESSSFDPLRRASAFRLPSAAAVETRATVSRNIPASQCRYVNIVAFLLGRLPLNGSGVPLQSSFRGRHLGTRKVEASSTIDQATPGATLRENFAAGTDTGFLAGARRAFAASNRSRVSSRAATMSAST
jgi:hypothetical protein